MIVLGISCYFHDSAACIIENGKVIAAVQEERFSRIKHDSSFPVNAIDFCLQQAAVTLSQLDTVVFYEKPFLKFERILETAFDNAPFGFSVFKSAIPIWMSEKLFMKKRLTKSLKKIDIEWTADKLKFSQHHLSHAASAYYPSGFNSSAVLVVDGVGEWHTCTIWKAINNQLQLVKEFNYPHSLGLFYSAFTRYVGFKVNSGEYKLMGLAPYGKPVYVDLIKKHLINLNPDGNFTLNMNYFGFSRKLDSINKRFIKLFGHVPRTEEEPLSQFYKDVAKSAQVVLEEAMLNLVQMAKRITGEQNLCMAGGVALNCVSNQKIAETIGAQNIFVQPASGDAGCSAGAALAYFFSKNPQGTRAKWQHCYFGPSYTTQQVEQQLQHLQAPYTLLTKPEIDALISAYIEQGKIVGWFYGAAEFGPRALGNRSILASPLLPDMKQKLNLSIKYREGFRPFAPVVIEQDAAHYFQNHGPNPYMLFTQQVLTKDLPSITHLDNSARVQTVTESANKPLYQLLQAFKHKTNHSVLINTSFNVRGEPPVLSPKHAYECFMNTEMDILVMEDCVLYKHHQPAQNKQKMNFDKD